VKAAVEASAKLCESLGHTIVPAQNPVNGQAFHEAFLVVWSSLPAMLARRAQSSLFEPYTLELADYFMKLPPDALPKAWAVFKETEAQVDAFLANYDAQHSTSKRSPSAGGTTWSIRRSTMSLERPPCRRRSA
jgi:amidase